MANPEGNKEDDTKPSLRGERRVVAWVGKSVIFTGTLISAEDLTVDGRVDGSIEVREHALIVGPDADIHAEIVATSATIHGSVRGNIRAHVKIHVLASATVDGDMTAPSVTIADGAIVHGRIETTSREKPRPAVAGV